MLDIWEHESGAPIDNKKIFMFMLLVSNRFKIDVNDILNIWSIVREGSDNYIANCPYCDKKQLCSDVFEFDCIFCHRYVGYSQCYW
ncbi:late transcription factor VLTF-1 [Turkeypox virus]|uniref:Late transcription factor VLTF-1 n=1 Tax=Turkeypox virus TaxID=336486 RepID=A0A0M3ZER3_9POXV|nr:late transcription factor VLTF-1 [Turkeypox virus]ALA62543.1 late transcription factor VLTF-1 [Turkeypox virus]